MTRKTIIAATIVATAALGSAALADQGHGHKSEGEAGYSHHGIMHRGDQGAMGNSAHMMQMMMQMHGQTTGGSMMDDGMMGRMGSEAGLVRMLAGNNGIFGAGTQEELRQTLESRLSEFDADADDALSLAEFETLHSALIREIMVDRFQYLDADGDGTITTAEMTAPAEHPYLLNMHNRNRAGQRDEMMTDQGIGENSMMNDN